MTARFPNLVMAILGAALAGWLAVAAPAGTAVAGPFEDGAAAINRGDYATALRLLRPLADQGLAGAQNNLGVMYDNGHGVPQDYAEAVKWYRKAADQGDADAQNNLGVMYRNGQGVPQDYVQAHKWFNLSASRSAAAERDQAVKNLEVIAAKMTPAQIAEAQRLAAQWKPN
jgi:TPR repeat protein